MQAAGKTFSPKVESNFHWPTGPGLEVTKSGQKRSDVNLSQNHPRGLVPSAQLPGGSCPHGGAQSTLSWGHRGPFRWWLGRVILPLFTQLRE